MFNFERLMVYVTNSRAWLEAMILLVILLLSYLLVHALGRKKYPNSFLMGDSSLSSMLFPLVALLATYATQSIWSGGYDRLTLFKIAIPILLSLVLFRALARAFQTAFPRSEMAMNIERRISWMAWLVAALWIAGFIPWMLSELESIRISFGKTKVNLRDLVEGLFSSILVLVLALWMSAILENTVLKHTVDDRSIRKVTANILRATFVLLGLIFALSVSGVDLTTLSVLGGALGVGLGFGLQKLAANYVSGFVILFERSLRIGDIVRIDGFEGQIKDIKTRYTLIQSFSGQESIVPNESLIGQRIENLTLEDSNLMLTTSVSISYQADPQAVQNLLVKAIASCPRVLADPPPAALLVKLGADGFEFDVNYWINDPENGQRNIISEVNMAIASELRRANIEIPYPQREIRIKNQPLMP